MICFHYVCFVGWWAEFVKLSFHGTTKYVECRQLATYEVLGDRSFSLAWIVYHLCISDKRFESQVQFFSTIVDIGYYGCHSRLLNMTLPKFFDMDNKVISNAMWNPHKNSQHWTCTNNNYAALMLQAVKTHSKSFIVKYYGTGSVMGYHGLKYYIDGKKTLADLVQHYDDKWQKDKFMSRIADVIDNICNSPLSFYPRLCIGLSRFTREKAAARMCSPCNK